MDNLALIYCVCFAIVLVTCFVVSACSKVKMMNRADKKYIFDIDTVKVGTEDKAEQ